MQSSGRTREDGAGRENCSRIKKVGMIASACSRLDFRPGIGCVLHRGDTRIACERIRIVCNQPAIIGLNTQLESVAGCRFELAQRIKSMVL